MSDGAPTSSPANACVESPAHARNAADDEIGSVFIFARHYFYGYLELGAAGGDRYLTRTQVETWVTANPFAFTGPPTPGGETKTSVTHVHATTGATTTDPVVYDPDQATYDRAAEARPPFGSVIYTLISDDKEKTEGHSGDATTPVERSDEVTLTEEVTHDDGAAAAYALLQTPDIDSYDSNTYVTIDDVDRPATTETADFTDFDEPEGIRGLAFYIGAIFPTFTEFLMQRSKTVMPPDLGEKEIIGATNTTPIIITTALDHGFQDGDRVSITGIVGNEDANGEWNIDDVTADSFELIDSAGSGAYASGGQALDLEYRVCIVTVKNPATVDGAAFPAEVDSQKCIPYRVLQEEESIYLDPACHRGLDSWKTILYRGSNDYPDSCLNSATSGSDPDCSLS
jgi:hypothetical protein